jgi:integrase
MAERKVNRLSSKQCDAYKAPGMYPDGGGLYLQLSKAGGKSWVFRYRYGGSEKYLGIGSYADVSLKDARLSADAARDQVKDGKNPILQKRIEAVRFTPEGEPEIPNFGSFARGLAKVWAEEFKSAPHKRAWKKTFGHDEGDLKKIVAPYAAPILDVRVSDIDTEMVLTVLRPIWKKAVTASRVRGRIERVLDAAKVLGHRSGDNPARWGGHLEVILKRPKKLSRGHHKAMPYDQIAAFVVRLRSLEWVKMVGQKKGGDRERETVTQSLSALALEFTILTASRTSEVVFARWTEISFEKRVWTVPDYRMKGGREHRVPLSVRALEVLNKVRPFSNDPDAYIFRGRSGDGHLSNMAMTMCLRGVDDKGFTVHGFRSTFRDWTGDETDFPREVAEAALAHLIGDEAEQAYRRGDALERRRKLMDAWAEYLNFAPKAHADSLSTFQGGGNPQEHSLGSTSVVNKVH